MYIVSTPYTVIDCTLNGSEHYTIYIYIQYNVQYSVSAKKSILAKLSIVKCAEYLHPPPLFSPFIHHISPSPLKPLLSLLKDLDYYMTLYQGRQKQNICTENEKKGYHIIWHEKQFFLLLKTILKLKVVLSNY